MASMQQISVKCLPASVKEKIKRNRLVALEKRKLSIQKGLHETSRRQALPPNVKQKIAQNRLAALERLRVSRRRRQEAMVIVNDLLDDLFVINVY
jgi:hypothetical protein